MPVTVTGRVTDKTGAVLPKLTVEARGDWPARPAAQQDLTATS